MQFSKLFVYLSASALLCAGLSSCAYIIPPDPNAPRNNTVQGDMHRPQMNLQTQGRQSALTPRNLPMSTPPEIHAENLPPVDSATKATADKMIASSDASALQASGRHVPVENAQFQMASNGYPPIDAAPPRPALSGPDSAKERLNAVQSDLVNDRDAAAQSKAALTKDIAAEPSMLSQLPKTDGVVPPNDPVRVAPVVVAPAPPAPAPIRLTPPGNSGVSLAPPLPPVANAGCAPIATNIAPVKTASITMTKLQPVVLTPPAMAQNKPIVHQGDFDPLAAADNAPLFTQPATATVSTATTNYASSGYMAPSRYAERRVQ